MSHDPAERPHDFKTSMFSCFTGGKTEKSCCGMFLVKNCTISHFQKKFVFKSLFMTQMSQLKDHM